MASTQNQLIKSRNPGGKVAIPSAASIRHYQGCAVFSIAASGYATDAIAAGANAFMGIAIAECDNSAGAAGDKKVEVYTGGEFELQGSSLTQALVGDKIYMSDNFTATGTSTNNTLVGRCTEFISSTRIMVKLEVGTQA